MAGLEDMALYAEVFRSLVVSWDRTNAWPVRQDARHQGTQRRPFNESQFESVRIGRTEPPLNRMFCNRNRVGDTGTFWNRSEVGNA